MDILRAGRLAIEFLGPLDRDVFADDLKTQSAVLHQLLVLGEAVKRLTESFRAAHPEISWHQIAGMRDRLIHDYDQIDLDLVWETVNVHIPHLIALLEPLEPRQPR